MIRIKLCTQALIHGVALRLNRTDKYEAAADVAGVSRSTIYHWCSENQPQTITAIAMVRLEKVFGYPVVSAMIAARNGEQEADVSDYAYADVISRLHKETSEGVQAIIDGCPAQARKEVPEAIAQMTDALVYVTGTRQ